MSFNVTAPIKAYNQPFALLRPPSRVVPSEGPLFIPIEINWDGTTASTLINLQGGKTNPISQIVMLDVDNSQCGSDVTFAFLDGDDSLICPAYSACTLQIYSNALSFYVIGAPLPLASDITRFRVMNFLDFPVVPAVVAPIRGVVGNASLPFASGSTTIIPGHGTLTGYEITGGIVAGAGAVNGTITISDSTTGQLLTQAFITLPSGGVVSGIVSQSDGQFSYRFANGILATIAVVGTAVINSLICFNCKFRSP